MSLYQFYCRNLLLPHHFGHAPCRALNQKDLPLSGRLDYNQRAFPGRATFNYTRVHFVGGPMDRRHSRTAIACSIALALLTSAAGLFAAGKYQPPFGEWNRVSDAPMISPTKDLAGIFNPAVIKHNDEYFMLARAQNRAGTSFLAKATSKDGLHFVVGAPALIPEADYEKDGGVEDPRLVSINGTFYLTYTGYNKKDAQLCLATSKELQQWT